ncbi:hypothetical protein IE077_003144 [Cardiosporidium cionae]|uniref:Uncharacterized protein n=1 Tax=Cardiosporidium cionae TaxID=476202 RepID=A0ABQ7JFM7_9APIC|nr:hypothetical protein IE077_003144 [Cardiosporidium cionae]|eukprot:KAF8822675.1 hypothetical protein IE077_003144 [Cardiosporidium cionae]
MSSAWQLAVAATRRLRTLPPNGKLLIGSLVFNVGLMVGIATLEYRRKKRLSLSFEQALLKSEQAQQASNACGKINNIGPMSCFTEAKLFRVHCSNLPPDYGEDYDMCRNLEKELDKCRDSLYPYIPTQTTPAMQPITGVVNLPIWLESNEVSK